MIPEVEDQWARINSQRLRMNEPLLDPKEWARIDTRETYILAGDSLFEKIDGTWNVIAPHHLENVKYQYLLIVEKNGTLYVPGANSFDSVQLHISGCRKYAVYRKIL